MNKLFYIIVMSMLCGCVKTITADYAFKANVYCKANGMNLAVSGFAGVVSSAYCVDLYNNKFYIPDLEKTK